MTTLAIKHNFFSDGGKFSFELNEFHWENFGNENLLVLEEA
jgi:hypothetical protein